MYGQGSLIALTENDDTLLQRTWMLVMWQYNSVRVNQSVKTISNVPTKLSHYVVPVLLLDMACQY